MPRIFISYRRDDSMGHAGRIHERLASVFGSSFVFMDVDDITPGTNFIGAIENSVEASDFMVVLIGKQWLSLKDTAGRRRIEDSRDFVHAEIAQALERNIPIIPVLLNNATMPPETELPDRLKSLARFQAMSLSEERWDYDIQRLVRILERKGTHQGEHRKFRRTAILLVALAIAVMALVFLAWRRPPPDMTGRWTAAVTYDFGDTFAEVFQFRVDDSALIGTASFLAAERNILDGKIEGDTIQFRTRSQERQGDEFRDATHQYRGTIGNGEIRFVMQTLGGFSDHSPIDFIAKRAP